MAGSGFSHTPNAGEFRNYGGPGARSTGAYMIGARPFIVGGEISGSGGTVRVTFPFVTRAITVVNKDSASDDIQIHFSSVSGSNPTDPGWDTGLHYITLDSKNQSMTMNVRAKEIFLTAPGNQASFELFAELTDILGSRMHTYDSSAESDIPASGYKGVDTSPRQVNALSCSAEVTEVP